MRRGKLALWFLVLILAVATVATGCGAAKPQPSSTGAGQTQPAPAPAKEFKVGLVTDVGGLNDHGFNELAYKGLQRAEKELGVKGTVVQSKQMTDYVPNLTNFAQQGYDVVVAVGFLMTDAVKQVAPKFPKTHFAIIDVPIDNIDNVTSAVFQTEQGGYLAGALSGLIEKEKALPNLQGKNTLGVVGGMQIPPVDAFIAGFQAGVKAVNPQATVILKYAGKFDDPAGGKSYALGEFAQGADIIFQVAGGTGLGVISAAKEKNLYAIGVDADQNYLAPETVITSVLKRVDVATFDLIKASKEGQFKKGIVTFNLQNDGVGIAKPIAAIPQAIVDKVAAMQKDIMAGKITPPAVLEKK